ncbi:PREDICTED: dnaJ homolog subfamily B member 4 [Theobroma cacao]|uniref:DnaJ homolog subfamily B member 4 n=1 Tax=Theobroma cacao TaxID=3641 RepID=A0AB32VHK2_THECC|nr:PREDICTED: dnaJ homolog subfamily B member 4 [Theobroma cacao]
MGDHSHHHTRSLSTDLYGILGISSKGSSIKDMCKAYKSLVHKWYPDHRSPSSKSEEEGNFKDIDEAYKTINSNKQEQGFGSSDRPSTREKLNNLSVDDSFFSRRSSFLSKSTSRRSTTPSPRPTYLSMSSSRRGSPSKTLNFALSRTFSRRSRADAETSPNVSGSVGGHSPSPLSRSMSRKCTSETEMRNISRSTSRRSPTPIIFSQSVARRKPPPVEKMLECTLEELCHGGLKKIKVIRDVISDEGIIVQEEETLTINLKPGWRKGTKVTFEGKGNEKPGYLPADIIFLIQEKSHPLFTRQGDDLEIAVEIPLVKALTGCSLSVPLLGGETMSIHFNDIIYPGYEKVIQGQGMPNAKEGKRGDLRITFLVNFPSELSHQQRSEACSILEDCS